MHIRLEFQPQDCWVGVFWKRLPPYNRYRRRTDLWICLLPMVPIHCWWYELGKGVTDAR